MLDIVRRAVDASNATNPWTNVYGLSRSLLAGATAATLLASPTAALFRPAAGMPFAPYCVGPLGWSFFCVLPGNLELHRYLAAAALLIVASGWRPRFTAIPHWWLTWSFAASATLVDGGDQASAILTLLLVPIALTDPRRWHWSPDAARPSNQSRLLANSALLAIRVQVAGIYLHSSLGKLAVTEWVDGTALYYWFTDPNFGAPGWLRPILDWILAAPLGVVLLTWGPLALEFALATALLLPAGPRAALLRLGIAFHLSIAVFMGISTFAVAMIAALVLYLRAPSEVLEIPAPLRSVLRPVAGVRARRRPALA